MTTHHWSQAKEDQASQNPLAIVKHELRGVKPIPFTIAFPMCTEPHCIFSKLTAIIKHDNPKHPYQLINVSST
jgi:hypothetical protein